MTEDQYRKELHCGQCGEKKNLKYDNNYGGWDRYICGECNYPIQIKAVDSQ